jgi:signal transduction histidine kinase
MPAVGWSSKILKSWHTRSLAMEFALAAALIFGAGMLGSATWLSYVVRQNIAEQTSLTTALFMQTLVEQSVQDLVKPDAMSNESKTKLLDILNHTALGKHVVSLKIWKLDGTILFATNANLIGKQFPLEGALAQAVRGVRTTEFDQLTASENLDEIKFGIPLLEVYVPIFEHFTEHQLVVAEMYIAADQLKKSLDAQTRLSWLFMSGLTGSMLLLLWSIARRADKTIGRQQQELHQRVSSLSTLIDDNAQLALDVKKANRAAMKLNDRYLRKLSADLHDGPGQLLALSLVRLDEILPNQKSLKSQSGRAFLVKSLKDAMLDLRNISAGLSLPEIHNLTVEKTLRLAVEIHEARTNTKVEIELQALPDNGPTDVKVALFRLAQVCLDNSFRHAGGVNQRLIANCQGQKIVVQISDGGPGPDWVQPVSAGLRLGLTGLKYRMIALGGTLVVEPRSSGYVVTATIPIEWAGE